MDDLVQFLRARLDEDEQIAKLPLAFGPGRWDAKGHAVSGLEGTVGGMGETPLENAVAESQWPVQATHIARHDPAHVLVEVDAKRQMLAEADYFCAEYEADTDDDNSAEQRAHCWRDTIRRLLAASYAAHPDYQSEWAHDPG